MVGGGRGVRGDDTAPVVSRPAASPAGAGLGGTVMSSMRALDVRLFDETVAAIALFAGSEHRLVYQNDACARLLGARPVLRRRHSPKRTRSSS